jgi:hypothetical protein
MPLGKKNTLMNLPVMVLGHRLAIAEKRNLMACSAENNSGLSELRDGPFRE